MAHVRSLVPDMWFLAPGVGAQGADLEKTVHAGDDPSELVSDAQPRLTQAVQGSGVMDSGSW